VGGFWWFYVVPFVSSIGTFFVVKYMGWKSSALKAFFGMRVSLLSLWWLVSLSIILELSELCWLFSYALVPFWRSTSIYQSLISYPDSALVAYLRTCSPCYRSQTRHIRRTIFIVIALTLHFPLPEPIPELILLSLF